MDALFKDKKRETALTITYAGGRVTFASQGEFLFSCNPLLLVQEVLEAGKDDRKIDRWRKAIKE